MGSGRITDDQKKFADLVQVISTFVQASGLTGAQAQARFVGGTASGAPVSGAFQTGDFIVDQSGALWVNTLTGAPGNWVQVGSAGSNYGVPGVTLATTNAAGVAATGIRTDASIAVFDTTAPVTQAFGDTAATGSAAVAARRDHKHGIPTLGSVTNNLNELAAGALTNATSTGDAGNRSDHFTGAALSGNWTVSGTFQNTGVAYSVWHADGPASGIAYITQPYTPSGDFKLEWRVRALTGANSAAGDQFFGVVAADNSMQTIAWNASTGIAIGFTGAHGSVASSISNLSFGGSATIIPDVRQNWVYMQLARAGSTFTVSYSFDRAIWTATSSNNTQAVTVANILQVVQTGNTGTSVDFVDVTL